MTDEQVKLAVVDQDRDSLDGSRTVYDEIAGGLDTMELGTAQVCAYVCVPLGTVQLCMCIQAEDMNYLDVCLYECAIVSE